VDLVVARVVGADRLERVEPDDEFDPRAVSMPRAAIDASSSGVKCSPAVGAAADAGSLAYTVW
jgi:hypothetical protein